MLCLPSHHFSDEGDWNKLNLIFRVFTENIMKTSYKNYHKIFAMFHKLNQINLLWTKLKQQHSWINDDDLQVARNVFLLCHVMNRNLSPFAVALQQKT